MERDGTARCGNGVEAMLAVKARMALLAMKAKLAFPPLKQLGPQPLPPLGRGGHMFWHYFVPSCDNFGAHSLENELIRQRMSSFS